MATSKQLHRIATNPSAHMKFMTTGRLPQGQRPEGPLVDLLRSFSPHDRCAIRGLTVDPSLGYQGTRTFGSAEQAFRWVHPDTEVFGAFPAESWRIKNRTPRLFIEDLLAKASAFPDNLAQRYPRLRRPVPAGPLEINLEASQKEAVPQERKGPRP